MAHFLIRLYDRSIGSLYISLYNDMDGVKVLQAADDAIPDSPPYRRIINRRYLLPCLLYSFYLLDTLYLFLCGDPQWSLTGNATSDGTIYRKLLPASVAQQADVFFLAGFLMLLGIAAQFLFHNMEPFEEQFRMVALLDNGGNLKEMKQNGKVLPKVEAEAILAFHKRAIKLSKCLILIILLFAYPFYNANALLNWSATLAEMKGILLINLTIPYVIMHLYVAICCFVFNCRYLRIRQRTQMERLQCLIAQVNQTLRLLTKRRVRARFQGTKVALKMPTWSSLAQFKDLNRHLNVLSLQISGFNAFWSRYLSVYFAGLTFLVTYMAYLSLKLARTEQNLLAVAFLSYFILILLELLLWITFECSVLVVNNKETLKLQRIFTVRTSCTGKMPLFTAIKFDHIEADSKSIGRIGFKLLDSVQINSQMFELLFFYISSLFMKIVQHKL